MGRVNSKANSEDTPRHSLGDYNRLAASYGLNPRQLNRLQKMVEEHKNEIKDSW